MPATISYSANAGQDLSSDEPVKPNRCASPHLTQLNAAIANVAAQDGYIGAPINTLNSA